MNLALLFSVGATRACPGFLSTRANWRRSVGPSVERAEALEEEQRFPVGRGRARYRLVLLPCSNQGFRVDHMLCHVSRLAEQPKLGAVASFKRWLAS